MLFIFLIYIILINVLTTPAVNTPNTLILHHYPVEDHLVETKDHYILKIFRIPSSPRYKSVKDSKSMHKPVFFFQHGLAASSDMYLLNGPNDGLPFMLADAGYDVWLGNARGNRYSRSHKTLNPNKKEFWKFSWHEIGVLDLPAMIQYVLDKTHQSALHFVGHSQGCTTFLVLMSMVPEFNHKIKTSYLLAPAAWMKNMKETYIKSYFENLPDGESLPYRRFLQSTSASLCKASISLCSKLFFLVTGKSSPHLNTTALPMLVATQPAGMSSRQAKHFLQLYRSGKFRQYDFGKDMNLEIYNRSKPPKYPLFKINPLSRVHIYYSNDDQTVSAKDVLHLASHLKSHQLNLVDYEDWVHMDFIIANTVKEVINIPILRNTDEYEKNVNGRKPIKMY